MTDDATLLVDRQPEVLVATEVVIEVIEAGDGDVTLLETTEPEILLVATGPLLEVLEVPGDSDVVLEVSDDGVDILEVGQQGPPGPPGVSAAYPPIAFAFGDATPRPVFTAERMLLLRAVRLAITVPFDGVGAALSVGQAGDLEAFQATDQNDPGLQTEFATEPNTVLFPGQTVLLAIDPGAGPLHGAGFLSLDLAEL